MGSVDFSNVKSNDFEDAFTLHHVAKTILKIPNLLLKNCFLEVLMKFCEKRGFSNLVYHP